MDMPTPTIDSMSMASSMPTSTSSSSTTTMGMDTMAMTFFASTSTPLWSSAFTPHTAGEYAGICIFLITFTTVFRLLLAIRVNFFAIIAAARQRRYRGLAQAYTMEDKSGTRPWRANEAVVMATLDVVIAGVSYLLMLAVMTFNVGYFLSILSGVFLGSLICGRFTGSSGTH